MSYIRFFISLFFLFSFSIFSCTPKQGSKKEKMDGVLIDSLKTLEKDTIKCNNDPKLYTEIVENLLYKDSISNVYLKRKQLNMVGPLGGELTKCEKLPYAYLDEVGTSNDSIGFISDIVDVISFKRLEKTDTYFIDTSSVYAYRDDPVGYPPFYQIDIDQKHSTVIDSFYIKDESKIYWKGIKIKNVDVKSFRSETLEDKNGRAFYLVFDKNQLYFRDKPYEQERFENLPLKRNVLDSLRNIFFKK